MSAENATFHSSEINYKTEQFDELERGARVLEIADAEAAQALTPKLRAEMGREGSLVAHGSHAGCNALAVFCSGGDAQGMNGAVRAVVRMGIYCGCRVYFIKEGYKGLVEGGSNIEEATWGVVSGMMQLGGTIIGSARCDEFRTREGRKTSALNLVQHGITNLVCIGGDGSLTGANIFRNEWPSLLDDLLSEGKITQQLRQCCANLNIVGLVGSIDNDFCGTDMTIGADSALHRITEAIDCITTTAHSHQRCFVLEVMGRHCGYLALVSALACEADWVFIPELPPDDGWEDKLCDRLEKSKKLTGQRLHIIIVAEGAVDSHLKPLTADAIRDLVSKRLHFDARSTILGHVQRGGAPSAFDRILSTRMGAEAVLALLDAKPGTPACVIALDGNQIVRVPLMQAVEMTQSIARAMREQRFKDVVALRGQTFRNNLEIYTKLAKLDPLSRRGSICETGRYNLGVMHIGAPAGGMNAATRAFVRMSLFRGHNAWGIFEGMEGLTGKENRDRNVGLRQLGWSEVYGWNCQGGSNLGSNRTTALDVGLDRVAAGIKRHDLHGLLIIGGFEAYMTAIQLVDGREKHPELCIPICLIPATISNNVPGTDFSLGADTSVNEITNLCDRIKQSATGTKRRVFVVETMGGYCGYLATMAGIAGGADAAYIFEEPFNIKDLQNDVDHLRAKIADNVQRGLVLRNENANVHYTTDFIEKLYTEESQGVFTCRSNILGHVQQGGTASTFDRLYGTKLAARSLDFFEQFLTKPFNPNVSTRGDESAVLIGIVKRAKVFFPINQLKEMTDFKHRMPKAQTQWWMKLRSLLRILAKHTSLYTYTTETEAPGNSHPETH